MTDTTISDAVVFPEDEGTGVADGSEDFDSAGYYGSIGRALDTAYVDTGLSFTNIDTSNNTVDVTSGIAFLPMSSVDVQSGSQSNYDTTLPSDIVAVVALPSNVTGLSLAGTSVNDLWLAFDPSTNDGAYIRHGNGLTAPSDPSVKLGTVDTNDGSVSRVNDGASVEANDIVFTERSESELPSSPSSGQLVNINGTLHFWSE